LWHLVPINNKGLVVAWSIYGLADMGLSI